MRATRPRGLATRLLATRGLATRGLARRLLGMRLFAAADAEARRRGWQVRKMRGGLVHRYRDPRFDGRRGRS